MSRLILLHYDRTVAGIKPVGRPLTLFVHERGVNILWENQTCLETTDVQSTALTVRLSSPHFIVAFSSARPLNYFWNRILPASEHERWGNWERWGHHSRVAASQRCWDCELSGLRSALVQRPLGLYD